MSRTYGALYADENASTNENDSYSGAIKAGGGKELRGPRKGGMPFPPLMQKLKALFI